ncbi:uncharacterized protein RAG0_17047 [Rhynchosporium agropyri]|uniref:Uncharacterized protein n=2 Tax=Rhynchosporium TaxID=38037 RepID=A0A1E1MW78_RHYSE|nr:uncharacterized protein RAG0_17047 [Rhynchosporium agropyri]CZT53324.1 uncharacterized protein RSE6_14817 [Rhynchosporium secalis]
MHGATNRVYTLCRTTRESLACTNAIYVQRPVVTYLEAIRFICTKHIFFPTTALSSQHLLGFIRRLNREILAKNSKIGTIQRAIREVMSLKLEALRLRERASTACETLSQQLT